MSGFALRGTKLPTSSYSVVSQNEDRPLSQSATSAASSDDEEEDLFRSHVEDPLERDARDAVREGILFRKISVVLPAAATVGANIFAIISSGAAVVVLIAGAIAVILSAAIVFMEVSMEDLDSLRADQQDDYRNVAIQAKEKSRLEKRQKELELKVFCLKEDERRLIAEMNDPHKGRKYLRGLVAKSKSQVGEKTEAFRQYVLTDVMNLVIRADKDESGEFDDGEIKHLIRYIKALPSIKVNEKKFSKAIKKERSLVSVLALVQDLGRKDIPTKKRIFTFDEKQIELQVIAMSQKHESKPKRKSGEKKAKKKTGDTDAEGIKKKKTGDTDSAGTKKKKKKKNKVKNASDDSSIKSTPPRMQKSGVARGDFNHPMMERSRGNLNIESAPPARKSRSKSPLSQRFDSEPKTIRSRSLSPIRGGGGSTSSPRRGKKKLALKGLAPFHLPKLRPKSKKDTDDPDSRSGFF